MNIVEVEKFDIPPLDPIVGKILTIGATHYAEQKAGENHTTTSTEKLSDVKIQGRVMLEDLYRAQGDPNALQRFRQLNGEEGQIAEGILIQLSPYFTAYDQLKSDEGIKDEERTIDRARFREMLLLHGSAVSYASWQYMKSGLPKVELRSSEEFKEWKKGALTAMFELYEIRHLPEGQKAEALKNYRTMWGERAEAFEGMFHRIDLTLAEEKAKQEANGQSEELATDEMVAPFLKDIGMPFFKRGVPFKRKRELLMHAGYTKKDAGLAAVALVGAFGASFFITHTAEPGAIAAGAKGAAEPHLHGLTIPTDIDTAVQVGKALGWAGGAFGTYQGVSWAYAYFHTKLLEKTGFGMNLPAAVTHHVEKASGVPKKQREKHTRRALWGFNFALDAPYVATIAAPVVGPSIVTNVYVFGTEYTLVQTAVCIGLVGAAEVVSKGVKIKQKIEDIKRMHKINDMVEGKAYPLSPFPATA